MVWFHLTHATGLVKPGSWMDRAGSYGWTGVEVFFVISGFIIPYSMVRNGYRVRDFGRFVLKRVARLEPAYFVSIATSLLIAGWYWLDSGRTGFPYSAGQVLLHLGYLNAFAGYPWIDQVFWMLEVEVQFYLLAGLAFPLFLKRTLFWLAVAPLCVAASFAIRRHDFVFQYLPFFLLGIAAFHYRRKLIGVPAFVVLVVVLSICVRFQMGGAPAAAGLLAAIVIGTVNWAPRPLVALGTISYSLYLTHGPVNQLVRTLIPPPLTHAAEVEVAFLNLVCGLAAAWILFRTVERPSQRLAGRIRYKGT